jgi:hypothetical protein
MIAWFEWSHEPWPHDADRMMHVCCRGFPVQCQIYLDRPHASALKFRASCTPCYYRYVTAALIKCMEVLYIHHMKVLLYNQVYGTKIFNLPAGGEWQKVTCTTYFLLFFLAGCILREGPRSQGASWGVCGSGVPPYDFLNLYGVFDCRFSISFSRETARTNEP